MNVDRAFLAGVLFVAAAITAATFSALLTATDVGNGCASLGSLLGKTFAAFAALCLAAAAVTIVAPQHVGLVCEFGIPIYTLPAGIHFKRPWTVVEQHADTETATGRCGR